MNELDKEEKMMEVEDNKHQGTRYIIVAPYSGTVSSQKISY